MTRIAPPRTDPPKYRESAVEASKLILGMGHNQPPLEESILMDFDSALRDREGLLARIDEMEKKADQAQPCENDDTAGRMGDFIKMASAAVKAIEEEREKLNRPLLTAQRALKGKADSYSSRANAAGAKVRALLDAYLERKERERRAEVARLAEIERQAEAERQRVIREAREEAERVAEVERKRLQDIADAEAEAERKRLQAEEDASAAAEAREVQVVEVVAETVVVEAAPVFVPEPEPAFNPLGLGVGKAPLRGDYGTAVSTVETWHVTVENIRQVPDAYLKHPTVIEALEKVIRPMIKGKSGLREIKGCRIYSTLGSSVR